MCDFAVSSGSACARLLVSQTLACLEFSVVLVLNSTRRRGLPRRLSRPLKTSSPTATARKFPRIAQTGSTNYSCTCTLQPASQPGASERESLRVVAYVGTNGPPIGWSVGWDGCAMYARRSIVCPSWCQSVGLGVQSCQSWYVWYLLSICRRLVVSW